MPTCIIPFGMTSRNAKTFLSSHTVLHEELERRYVPLRIIIRWKFKNAPDHKMPLLKKRQLHEKDEM